MVAGGWRQQPSAMGHEALQCADRPTASFPVVFFSLNFREAADGPQWRPITGRVDSIASPEHGLVGVAMSWLSLSLGIDIVYLG